MELGGKYGLDNEFIHGSTMTLTFDLERWTLCILNQKAITLWSEVDWAMQENIEKQVSNEQSDHLLGQPQSPKIFVTTYVR